MVLLLCVPLREVFVARNWNLAISLCSLTAATVANRAAVSTPFRCGWAVVVMISPGLVLVGPAAGWCERGWEGDLPRGMLRPVVARRGCPPGGGRISALAADGGLCGSPSGAALPRQRGRLAGAADGVVLVFMPQRCRWRLPAPFPARRPGT